MNWLSQEEIKRRAEISDEEALNVSIEHWGQICEAVRNEERGIASHIKADNCGLCIRHCQEAKPNRNRCTKCFLEEKPDDFWCTCCREWQDFNDNRTLASAQAMLNRLYQENGKMLCKKEAKKVCKEEKPEIRHGDYRVSEDGHIQFFVQEHTKNTMRLCNEKVLLNGSKDSYPLIENPIDSGNFINGLKRNAEDLEDVKIPVIAQVAHIHLCGNTVRLDIEDGYKTLYMNPEIATEIAHAILQEVATLRRQAKDC